MNTKSLFLVLTVLLTGLAAGPGQAQTIYTENFTGAATTNQRSEEHTSELQSLV